MVNPIRPTDDDARTLAQSLMSEARFAGLGVLDPATGFPMVSRVAFSRADDGTPLTLVSELSHHTRALRDDPRASLLIGEPGPKGDPLTHPRLTLQARAHFVAHATETYGTLRETYLKTHPKAQLYIDFTDFSFVLFEAELAHLNGGFGKAFTLTPTDLGLTSPVSPDRL